MNRNFDFIMEHTFEVEGGYVDHPRDPGGATNLGIPHRTLSKHRGYRVTKEEVRNLTKSEAKKIYHKYYWKAVHGDQLPDGLDLVVFDAGVNSGPRRSIQWLQEALGVVADGVIGPITLGAVRDADLEEVILKTLNIRRRFIRGLSTYSTFGRGWENRINNVEHRATQLLRNS